MCPSNWASFAFFFSFFLIHFIFFSLLHNSLRCSFSPPRYSITPEHYSSFPPWTAAMSLPFCFPLLFSFNIIIFCFFFFLLRKWRCCCCCCFSITVYVVGVIRLVGYRYIPQGPGPPSIYRATCYIDSNLDAMYSIVGISLLWCLYLIFVLCVYMCCIY